MSHLLNPRQAKIDPFAPIGPTAGPAEHFDLLTCPEALLPAPNLLAFLAAVEEAPALGCVHVGLRPSASSDMSHLFEVSELKTLIEGIRRLPAIVRSDLDPFSEWLEEQPANAKLNVACLFAKDADGQLRFCVHPKLVRSRFEFSPLHDDHMHEADLLTVVTLRSRDARLLSVTLQPLICSDALPFPTDTPNAHPIPAITSDAACFGETPPEHVDVVSIVTCSPQSTTGGGRAGTRRARWHEQFRQTFTRPLDDDSYRRHKVAIFVMSNFGTFHVRDGIRAGGLSGAFLPFSIERTDLPHCVALDIFGHADDGSDKRWEDRYQDSSRPWKSIRGHIVALNSDAIDVGVAATLLGFTIPQLPRDAIGATYIPGASDFALSQANDATGAHYVFERRGSR